MTLPTDTPDDGFVINGKLHRVEDLTFREQRELRKIVRELADDSEANLEEMAVMDVVPAFVYVVMKRDDAGLNMDDVLDMKLTDFIPSEPNGNGNGNGKADPTKGSGTSGRRKSQPSTA